MAKTAKIPADKPATGGFQDLVDGIDQLLMGETDDLLAHPEKVSSEKMKHFLHIINWQTIMTEEMSCMLNHFNL